ncbi:MAG: enoyl-CoA hydratase/isomerase family protein [Spiribacter salinus]|uniref:Enoyl-CoA hydratase/isomerase family protein n=1 Tax=Spiribacter salinus TaxID=1335746 RepID=A0A540VTV4_9GAMM|nr:MAG: enoyl-CoA hydratase/isomerase family protein [Spiribacter salinus]
MYEFVKVDSSETVGTITLNRPNVLNAWHSPMRQELAHALTAMNDDEQIRAVILTGAGDRAFSAGQDLHETRGFDPDRAEGWVDEWRSLYGTLRGMRKPVVAALNGVAAGSAFQIALQCDIRVGHAGSKMGQPEIDAGIASTLGPWLMNQMLGLSRTIELTLTGRMMDGEECARLGLIHHLVADDEVMTKAMEVATALAAKPPIAMSLNKARFEEVTRAGFEDALAAGSRNQRESYANGEPQRMMEAFFAERARRKSGKMEGL